MNQINHVNLLAKGDLINNQNWRFVPEAGVLIAIKPIKLTNAEFNQLTDSGRYDAASFEELMLAFSPYDSEQTYIDKAPAFPWGNKDDMKDATPFFARTGISRSGIAMGVHAMNYWSVLRDGIRIGGAYNILGVEAGAAGGEVDENAVKRASLRAALRRGSLEGSVAKAAGVYGGQELLDNEAYLLVKKPTDDELNFFAKARAASANRLSADGGIMIICPPDFEKKKYYFAAAGNCQDCPNIDTITAIVQKKLIKDATGLDGELLPEYKDWNKIFSQEHSRIKAPPAFGGGRAA